jgi:hypothetical protein
MSYSLFNKYSIDTRELINGCRKEKSRKGLEILIRQGQLKTPPSVRDEISRVDDDIYAWVKRWENELIMELSELGLEYVGMLVNKYRDAFHSDDNPGITYPGLIKYETAGDADPDVIALAMEHDWTVVAEEKGITGACKIEKVNRISLKDLLDTEIPGWEKKF